MSDKSQDGNSIPWDPAHELFPPRRDLPKLPGAPEDAAWVWGKDDFCGRLNLLTPARVKAASGEIKTGESAPLDLPTNVPAVPGGGRQEFKHEIKALIEGVAYDDIYTLNTQSGTQWDGFRHASHISTATFYNGAKVADFVGPSSNEKCSIHFWRDNGFTGRGVLLDYRSYAESKGFNYDTSSPYSISFDELEACGKYQGINILPASQGGDIKVGDILFIRSGWVQDYNNRTSEENKALAMQEEFSSAGVKQEPKMLDWLHDCYFAAVAGDSPTFERWPTAEAYLLHEYILALWGMPIGEMVDLERVSELAKKNNRYTFFITSAPFRTHGGVASFLNATAIF
ncbi:hypothetical protein BP6252_10230 [Coleophoma cylindrospora]|uniref:Cyclase protein n=1 Tax=Coleophoma cylindrospora TaxID=1849047 RepID=A0A3D8QRY9_9HELO|nr:hypothetical protein BP6252_10230 [Coleophoma cylindrospora]